MASLVHRPTDAGVVVFPPHLLDSVSWTPVVLTSVPQQGLWEPMDHKDSLEIDPAAVDR